MARWSWCSAASRRASRRAAGSETGRAWHGLHLLSADAAARAGTPARPSAAGRQEAPSEASAQSVGTALGQVIAVSEKERSKKRKCRICGRTFHSPKPGRKICRTCRVERWQKSHRQLQPPEPKPARWVHRRCDCCGNRFSARSDSDVHACKRCREAKRHAVEQEFKAHSLAAAALTRGPTRELAHGSLRIVSGGPPTLGKRHR